MTRTHPSIYLAGPGIFRRDAASFGEELCTLCRRYGLEGFWPADGRSRAATSRQLFDANLALLRSADGVVADISPFRGPHSDDGTAWEIGFACALGMPVFAWTRDTNPLAWRIEGSADADGVLRDAEGHRIEDFAAPANLMIVEACRTISATPKNAIVSAARYFQSYLKPV